MREDCEEKKMGVENEVQLRLDNNSLKELIPFVSLVNDSLIDSFHLHAL